MILKLPHIKTIDTLNIPENFEGLVKESFRIFTEMTAKEYTFEDKMMYLDNLRGFLHPKDAEESVKDLILKNFSLTNTENFLTSPIFGVLNLCVNVSRLEIRNFAETMKIAVIGTIKRRKSYLRLLES